VRRLARQIRWAFLPVDELNELISGPFLDLEDRGIRSRFDDLDRESARAVETVRDIAGQVQQIVELADSMKTDRLNATIYVLTVVATVLVVPTLIAGIYGMNFTVIPGARAHAGFWIVILVMVAVSVAVWFGIRRYLDRVFRQGT
jgi:magnesium transporter